MTGTRCERCGEGWLVVTHTRRTAEGTVRYHACWLCAHRPDTNKVSTRGEFRRARSRCQISGIPLSPNSKPEGTITP